MTANYTRGEWIKEGTFIFSSEDPPRLIAEVIRKNMSYSENQANAHLIKVAPAMYEALKVILDSCEFLGDEYSLRESVKIYPTIELVEALQSARESLAKAEEIESKNTPTQRKV